ncbi:hypothetical protein D3C87_2101680 [compost metagenome]
MRSRFSVAIFSISGISSLVQGFIMMRKLNSWPRRHRVEIVSMKWSSRSSKVSSTLDWPVNIR